MNKQSEKQISSAVKKELSHANRIYPLFQNLHEGYAVLLEEAEEAQEALDIVNNCLAKLWLLVRKNDNDNSIEVLNEISQAAKNTMGEAGQVAAMAEKFLMLVETEKYK